MKVCEDINIDDKENLAALVITGDGRREFEVLKGISTRYDEERVLWFPKIPIKMKKIKEEKKIGLSSLNVVPTYISKYKIYSFLFLVDKEHVDKNPKEQIKKYIKNKVKIDIKGEEEINNDINNEALHFSCKFGSQKIDIYVCIFGKEKRIEEDIAALINLKGGKVKSEKREIKEFLHKHNTELNKFIEKSSKEKVESAFPGLTSILKRL